jgi:hypothetical protein
MQIASAADALKVGERENLSLVMSSKYPFENETLMDHDSVPILASKSSEVVDFNSKPRTALFQGGENDEPMAGQINSGSNSLNENNDSIISSSNNLKDRCFIKFGAFSVDVKQMLKAGNMDSMVTLPAKLIFQGDNFLKKIEATKQRRFIQSGHVSSRENIEKPRKYIFIGLLQVEIIEETPS